MRNTNSAIALAKRPDFDWEKIFRGADWFHWTGITPALSQGAADVCIEAVRAANRLGLTVSCDLNYRKNLWKYGKKASEVIDGEKLDVILAGMPLKGEDKEPVLQGLLSILKEKYGTAVALSAAWNSEFSSFDDLARPIEKASAFSPAAEADIRAFSALLTERYMRIPAEACRRADPHHMILGMRWAWISDPLLVSGWDAFDVFSINCYAVDPTPALDQVRKLGVNLPVVIGEFHFGALDRGLPATGLEAVRDQEDRGRAFRYYAEHAAACPNGVGCHWFQCYDQFALGRFDGENYNIGLFDITLRPHPELCAAVTETAGSIYAVKGGEQTPTGERPESLPMIAY